MRARFKGVIRMSNQLRKQTLGMAGEYFVAAQLNARGIPSSITYGNAKKADIVAYSGDKNFCEVIEVKTTAQKKWVIGNVTPQKSEDLWCLVYIPESFEPEYFILTSRDLNEILTPYDLAYRERYFNKHGKKFEGKGVVSIKRSDIVQFQNSWNTISERFSV